VIFDKKIIFDKDIEAAKLELKKTQTAQNMSLDQLTELLQQLNEKKLNMKLNIYILDNETAIISDINDTDSDNHDSHEDQL